MYLYLWGCIYNACIEYSVYSLSMKAISKLCWIFAIVSVVINVPETKNASNGRLMGTYSILSITWLADIILKFFVGYALLLCQMVGVVILWTRYVKFNFIPI